MAQQDIETLKRIIATSTVPQAVEKAKKELERLEASGAAQLQVAAALGSEADPQVIALLDALNKVAGGVSGGTVNPADVRNIVLSELALRKINYDDFSLSLKAQIDKLASQVTVQFNVNDGLGTLVSSTVTQMSVVDNKLIQLILSDLDAHNNVYLYGGAGTGKTFISEQVADLMGWKAITLNCNQYTSPLDIIGGQTIDGYQEGKLSIAWANEMENQDGTVTKYKGCVLILDELPKIDPNTAGILNDALAKIKRVKYDAQGNPIKPTIANGRNKDLPLGNLFIIATGNVPLNTIDPDYEANFKQDLSLQDRFIGSTYKVFVNYDNEFNVIMKGFAFLWIFCTKVREAIEEVKATGQAFVSIRLMENLRNTYKVFRNVESQMASNIPVAITKPKTLIDGLDTFFLLIKKNQRDTILSKVDYEGFKKIVEEKNKMPYDPLAPNFDTASELTEAQNMIARNLQKQKNLMNE
jgi:Cdc6-like AAA superfamily ATPase